MGEDGTDDAGVDAVNAGDDGTDDEEDDEDEAMTNAEKEIVGAASRREGENDEVAECESLCYVIQREYHVYSSARVWLTPYTPAFSPRSTTTSQLLVVLDIQLQL